MVTLREREKNSLKRVNIRGEFHHRHHPAPAAESDIHLITLSNFERLLFLTSIQFRETN